jgi:peptidoglycan/LPS O-acetylase OafA/YrhL
MTELSSPPAAGAAGTARFHFPGFDGLRAIAAMSVAVTHSTFISGFNLRNDTWGPYTARMDIGVAVFFVISGFLLYRPFVLARVRGSSSPATLPYFRRRFLRIYPAFWLVVTLVLIVPSLHGLTHQTPSFGGLVAHYTLTHIYFHEHVLGPVQQSWTLATEISFYVFLPVWALLWRLVDRVLARRPSFQLGTELAGLAFLYLLSVAFRLWLFEARPPELNGMYNTWLPARIDLFALGMLLAVASAWVQAGHWREPAWLSHRLVPYASWAVALGSFWFLSVGFGLNDPQNRGPVPTFSHAQQMWLQFFWGVTGFFLVAPAVFGPQDRGVIRRFLTLRVVAWLGLVSYGIYLWHEAMIDWYLRLTEPIAFGSNAGRMTAFMIATTLVVSAISYYALERPVLRLKDRPLRTWFGSRPVRTPEPR